MGTGKLSTQIDRNTRQRITPDGLAPKPVGWGGVGVGSNNLLNGKNIGISTCQERTGPPLRMLRAQCQTTWAQRKKKL